MTTATATGPTSICFFNNKGGVGKTTLACNVASFFADLGKRTLLVDADPQCNSTQLVLEPSSIQDLYLQDDTERTPPTINSILEPILLGDSSIRQVDPTQWPKSERFGISIVPGHPRLALLEDKLSGAWRDFKGGEPGGARITNWTTQMLIQPELARQFDYVIFDVGPSLGALNRSILVGVQYIVVPMGCDIFSLIGVDNIGSWLADWKQGYTDALTFTRRAHPNLVQSYPVKDCVQNSALVAGYTVQQYITKTIKGVRRPTDAYDTIIQDVPRRLQQRLGTYFAPGVNDSNMHLGDVPHMFSLVPLAQNAHVPIHRLTSSDGLAGGQRKQLDQYRTFIDGVCTQLLANLQPRA